MTKFLQTSIDGLAVGSLYALIALGYTMVYGTLKFINFSHASVFMLGAWFSLGVARLLGWGQTGAEVPIYAALVVLLATMTICGALGFAIERLAYKPLRSAPRLNVLITAIGIAMLIDNTAALEKKAEIAGYTIPIGFGTRPQRMPSLFQDKAVAEIAGVNIQFVDIVVVISAVVLMAGLQLLVFGTKLGAAMRAVSEDTRAAALMGIPVDRVISITFVVGTMLAAAAGFLFAAKYPGLNQPAAANWALLGLKAFVAAVVGGIGNIRGAVVGGILIGMIELFGAAYLFTQLRDVYVFVILIAVLLVRPTGLFPSGAVNKV